MQNSNVTAAVASVEPQYWEENNPVLLETLAEQCNISKDEAAEHLAAYSDDLKVLDGEGPILTSFVNEFVIEGEHADV